MADPIELQIRLTEAAAGGSPSAPSAPTPTPLNVPGAGGSGMGDIFGKVGQAIGGQAGGLIGKAGSFAELLGGAAGPAALAIGGYLAIDQAAKFVAGKFTEAAETVGKFGDVAKSLAGNDNLGALTKASDAVAESFGKIPIVGQIYEAEMKAATAVVRTFAEVTESFVERGRQLAQYSAPLSEAGAISHVRDILADIREADTLGPDLARLTDIQSQMSIEFRELMLPIKQFIIEVLAEFLQEVLDIVRGVKVACVAIQQYVEAVVNIMGDFARLEPGAVAGHIAAARDAIVRAIEHQATDPGLLGFGKEQIEALKRSAASLRRPASRDPILGAQRGQVDQQVRVPLFGI